MVFICDEKGRRRLLLSASDPPPPTGPASRPTLNAAVPLTSRQWSGIHDLIVTKVAPSDACARRFIAQKVVPFAGRHPDPASPDPLATMVLPLSKVTRPVTPTKLVVRAASRISSPSCHNSSVLNGQLRAGVNQLLGFKKLERLPTVFSTPQCTLAHTINVLDEIVLPHSEYRDRRGRNGIKNAFLRPRPHGTHLSVTNPSIESSHLVALDCTDPIAFARANTAS